MKIKILTRSMNYDLYNLSMGTINLPYSKKRCCFTWSDSYFYKNVLFSDADIVINIDEDAFVLDNARLEKLLEYVLDNGYVNCGMPDGGVVSVREYNPLVTNPFFNILNVKKIRERWNKSYVLDKYSVHDSIYEKNAPKHLMRKKYDYVNNEPYVPFFVWLSNEFKVLYLDAQTHHDNISTTLLDQEGQPFLCHSWYSRFYGSDLQHTTRINNLYKEVTKTDPVIKRSMKRSLIRYFDQIGASMMFFLENKVDLRLQRLKARCLGSFPTIVKILKK